MKLLRYGSAGKEKPGILDGDGNIRDISGEINDIVGDVLSPVGLAKIAAIDVATLPKIDGNSRLGPCVGQTGKFMCIGLNYSDHALESGMEVPPEPVLFTKFTSAMCGADDNIIIPRGATKTDWEVELGVIIGQSAKYVAKENALDYVAGYCVINDVSEREFQLEGTGQWVKGKSSDTFGPTGPWLVTKDEISDVQNLSIWLEVNGEKLQNSSTSYMVYDVAFLVSYLSNFFTLHPGDIISTGTPPGVGLGFNPPRYLKAGDTMRLGIEGMGEQNQTCIADG